MEIWKRKIKSSGVTTLYLDYMSQGKRIREPLHLKLYPGRSARRENENTMRLAEAIRARRDHELRSGAFGMVPQHRKKEPFLEWMADHVKQQRSKGNYRMYRAMHRSFERFIGGEIYASAISKLICEKYQAHLQADLNGETPYDYFKIFRRVLNAAVEAGFFTSNPSAGIRNINPKAGELTKEVLDAKEIQKLAKTWCGNDEVKRAFLFSTQTGLRFSDIVALHWGQVHLRARKIVFSQVKTRRRNDVPLNANAVKLLGKAGKPQENVFTLPSSTAVNKDLKKWVKRAGIQKHITFHCGRHSAGTNLHGATGDIYVVSRLLGHSSLSQTVKYARVNDEKRRTAVDRLPKIRM